MGHDPGELPRASGGARKSGSGDGTDGRVLGHGSPHWPKLEQFDRINNMILLGCDPKHVIKVHESY